MAYVPPEQVGADAEQRKKYDEQMKEMLRDPFWELKQAGNAATQKALEQKKQEASDAKTRAQIKALSGDTREAMDHAISLPPWPGMGPVPTADTPLWAGYLPGERADSMGDALIADLPRKRTK